MVSAEWLHRSFKNRLGWGGGEGGCAQLNG